MSTQAANIMPDVLVQNWSTSDSKIHLKPSKRKIRKFANIELKKMLQTKLHRSLNIDIVAQNINCKPRIVKFPNF